MEIIYKKRSEIVEKTWNDFTTQSPQRLMYAYSWYLDVVAPRWGALVAQAATGEWLGVLPVPLRRKFGVWVVHQPLFCQWLGVFYHPTPNTAEVASRLLTALPLHFGYTSVYAGCFEENISWPLLFKVQKCSNLVLSLNQPYEAIFEAYTPDRRANLKRAQAEGWQVEKSQNIEPLIELFRQHHAAQIEGGVSEKSYDLLRKLVKVLQQKRAAQLLYAQKEGGIEAGILLATDQHRVIYLFNAASEQGRRGNARTLLIDHTLRAYANQNKVFDFESPEVPSIAHFYRSFGSQAVPYATFRYNALPLFLQKIQRWRLSLLPSPSQA